MKFPDWLKVSGDLNEGSGDVTMLLHAPIGQTQAGDGISSREFGACLNAIPSGKNITLDINTLGGKVDDGIAMHNMLLARGNVTTRVVGYAASMGAIIHQAGAKRVMMPGTMLVIHNPMANPGSGEQKDLYSAGDFLGKVKGSLVDLLSKRSGQKPEKVSAMMDAKTGLSPEEAKKMGFCDEIVSGSPAFNDMSPVAMFDFLKELTNSAEPGHPFYGNQHTDSLSEAANMQGMKADDESKKAEKVGAAGNHEDARDEHYKASRLHQEAADKGIQNKEGNNHRLEAARHRQKADDHAATARRLRSVTDDLSANGPAIIGPPTKDSMKLTIASLAGLVTIPAEATDEQAAPVVKTAVNSLVAERDKLKTENESFRSELKIRVTNLVEKAITAKLVKAERKDDLIAMGLSKESALDFLDDIAAQVQPAGRRGAAPAPAESEGGETLASLRGSLNTSEEGDEHVVATGRNNASVARKLRVLRGHGDLFKNS